MLAEVLQGYNSDSSYYLVSYLAILSGFVMVGRKQFPSGFSSESACHKLCWLRCRVAVIQWPVPKLPFSYREAVASLINLDKCILPHGNCVVLLCIWRPNFCHITKSISASVWLRDVIQDWHVSPTQSSARPSAQSRGTLASPNWRDLGLKGVGLSGWGVVASGPGFHVQLRAGDEWCPSGLCSGTGTSFIGDMDRESRATLNRFAADTKLRVLVTHLEDIE